ncbi:unnamed protein product [Arabidopsis halleri]
MIGNEYGISNPFKGKKTSLLFGNSLSHNKWLKVRCKSGDNDVREKYMKPGEHWGFSFHDDVMEKHFSGVQCIKELIIR